MSTAQKQLEEIPAIYDGSVAKNSAAAGFTGIDPRHRRFGYHPGIYRMEVESVHSGQQTRVIPGGILVPFRTATLKVENFDINVDIDEYRKQVAQDFTAKWFIDNCKVNYTDQGFRELHPLTMLDDPVFEEKGKLKFENFLKSPHGYFNQVHPSFGEIGHICPAGLTNCATCRAQLLGDDGGPGEAIYERIARCPDPEIADALREVLLDANVTLRDYYQQRWAVIMGEYEGRQKGEPGIGSFDDSIHHIRKHIHEVAPQERTALAAAGYGNIVANAQAEGMKDLANAFRDRSATNDSQELIALVIQTQQEQGEALRQQGEMLAKIGESIIKGNAQKPKPDKATEQAPE